MSRELKVMDKQIEETLKGFDAVWKRVSDSKSAPPERKAPAIMPRKNKKPRRRFEGGR